MALRKLDGTSGQLESLSVDTFTEASNNRYLFTGEQFDTDLGMYYLRARYLNTNNGRFHNKDTYEGRMGEPLTLHKYLYAHSDPVNNTDPSGNATLIGFTLAIIEVQSLRGVDSRRTNAHRRVVFATLCKVAAKFAGKYGKTVKRLRKSRLTKFLQTVPSQVPRWQVHHVFKNADMTSAFNSYSKMTAFGIPLLGGNGRRGSPHDVANLFQSMFGGRFGIRATAFGALRAAGCRNSDASDIVLAAEEHNRTFGGKRGGPLR